MAKKKVTIEWSRPASGHFQELLEYLHIESESASAAVGAGILDEIGKLETHPTAYPLDRFKKKNDGNYRALIVFSYRISYYINVDTVFILRIRHTSREPLEH